MAFTRTGSYRVTAINVHLECSQDVAPYVYVYIKHICIQTYMFTYIFTYICFPNRSNDGTENFN